MNPLKLLTPNYDDRGILLVKGRLNRIPFSMIAVNPIKIIPNRHYIMGLIVQHCLKKCVHLMVNATFVETQVLFWLVSGKYTVRYYFKNVCYVVT